MVKNARPQADKRVMALRAGKQPLITRARKRVRGERGSMLIEFLVSIIILSAVLGAIISLYRVSANQQRRVEGGVRGLVGQKNDLERMSRELRQATQVCTVSPACSTTFSNASSIEFQRCTPDGSGGCTLKWVRFDCSGSPAQAVPPNLTTRACLRSEATTPAGLGTSQKPLIRNVMTTPSGIFTLTGTSYVTISLRVQAKDRTNPLVLEDGIRIRNANETPAGTTFGTTGTTS
jgi:type II secretory pathway pseudopilin PulG